MTEEIEFGAGDRMEIDLRDFNDTGDGFTEVRGHLAGAKQCVRIATEHLWCAVTCLLSSRFWRRR